MFGFRSSEIFRKKTEFLNSRNFRKKVRKKFRNLSLEKSSVIIWKFQKNDVKFEVLGQKTLFFGQKVWKSSEISETGFSECSEISEIPNSPKITKKWRHIWTSEITKYSFRLDSETDPKVWNAGP